MNCPNCGHEITTDDRFCSNCGTRLEPVAPSPTQQEPSQDPRTEPSDTGTVLPTLGSRRNAWEVQRQQVRSGSVDDEWTMSDLGPPPPQKRRTWLWVIIAILALMVLSCCIFLYWVSYTDSGVEWISGIATEAAEQINQATEQASGTPVASPQP
jgi:hypothetical protein